MCVHPWLIKAKDQPFLNGSKELVIPCGRCPECIKAKQEQWLTRFKLEDMYWRKVRPGSVSYKIELTYDSKSLPTNRDRALLDIQAFVKQMYRKLDHRPRYYIASENGSIHGRLHFHCLFFGMPVVDVDLFRKRILESAWPHGFNYMVVAGGKEFRYVCKYVTKDIDAFHSSDWKTIESYSKRPTLGGNQISGQFARYFTDNCTTSFDDNGYKRSISRYMASKLLSDSQRATLLNKYEHERMPQAYNSSNPEQHFKASECWRKYYHSCEEYKKKKQQNLLNYERLSDIVY